MASEPTTRQNRVRARRRELDLIQAELAGAVGVSRQTVVALEAGDYAPSVYLALRLAAVLGTTVEDLFAEPGEDTHERPGTPTDEGRGIPRRPR